MHPCSVALACPVFRLGLLVLKQASCNFFLNRSRSSFTVCGAIFCRTSLFLTTSVSNRYFQVFLRITIGYLPSGVLRFAVEPTTRSGLLHFCAMDKSRTAPRRTVLRKEVGQNIRFAVRRHLLLLRYRTR